MDILAVDAPPGILLLMGIWLILCGTILCRPLNWLYERFDAAYYRFWGRQTLNYRIRRWILADRRKEWLLRGIAIAVGLLLIGLEFASGHRIPTGN